MEDKHHSAPHIRQKDGSGGGFEGLDGGFWWINIQIDNFPYTWSTRHQFALHYFVRSHHANEFPAVRPVKIESFSVLHREVGFKINWTRHHLFRFNVHPQLDDTHGWGGSIPFQSGLHRGKWGEKERGAFAFRGNDDFIGIHGIHLIRGWIEYPR